MMCTLMTRLRRGPASAVMSAEAVCERGGFFWNATLVPVPHTGVAWSPVSVTRGATDTLVLPYGNNPTPIESGLPDDPRLAIAVSFDKTLENRRVSVEELALVASFLPELLKEMLMLPETDGE